MTPTRWEGAMKMSVRWRPWRRHGDVGAWCWWCPCCRGGSWEITQPAALDMALRHDKEQHQTVTLEVTPRTDAFQKAIDALRTRSTLEDDLCECGYPRANPVHRSTP